MITVRKFLFSVVFSAVLLSPQCLAFRQKASTNVSAESLTRTIDSTRQSRDTDDTACRPITSVVNCTRRGSVVGVSGNTSTAGARNTIGTITTTTRQVEASEHSKRRYAPNNTEATNVVR